MLLMMANMNNLVTDTTLYNIITKIGRYFGACEQI